jgi:hypothetical protein
LAQKPGRRIEAISAPEPPTARSLRRNASTRGAKPFRSEMSLVEIDAETKRKFRLRKGKFRFRTEKFRLRKKNASLRRSQVLDIILGREIDDLAVCCDFKDLRRIRLRAAFALHAAPPGAAFGENFACNGEAFETFFHLVSLVGEPERGGSPEMELTLRQLAQLLDDPQKSRDRRGLAGVDLSAEQFLRLLQTRDLQKRVVVGGVAFASREFLGDDLLNATDAQPFGFSDLPQTETVHHRGVDMASALGFFAWRYRLNVRVGHGGASDEGREIAM